TQALLQTAVPAGVRRGAQVPVATPVLALVQPWHDRPHAPEQQTPSEEQKPLAHSRAAAQVVPVVFLATQAVPEQKAPAMQSVSAAQVVLHAVVPQVKGAQLVVTGAGQTPLPLQLAEAVATPAVQLAVVQTLVAGCSWQAPPAAHRPVLPHTGPTVQRVSAVPAASAAQVPLVAPVRAAEQAVHAPVQALLQQKPSTQNPEAHWAAVVQA